MKLIIAIIQPERLSDVKQALFKADIHKMTVNKVKGCGQQLGYDEAYRGQIKEINLLDKIRIEIGVNDDFVETTINTIIKAARTGEIGDGKIFVIDLVECIRIRTGEKGHDAIG